MATGDGLKAQYFSDTNFTVLILERVQPISFNEQWKIDTEETEVQLPEAFSARWTGKIVPPKTEKYQFLLPEGIGFKLWIGGVKISNYQSVSLLGGRTYSITIELVETGLTLGSLVRWKGASMSGFLPVPQSQLSPP